MCLCLFWLVFIDYFKILLLFCFAVGVSVGVGVDVQILFGWWMLKELILLLYSFVNVLFLFTNFSNYFKNKKIFLFFILLNSFSAVTHYSISISSCYHLLVLALRYLERPMSIMLNYLSIVALLVCCPCSCLHLMNLVRLLHHRMPIRFINRG